MIDLAPTFAELGRRHAARRRRRRSPTRPGAVDAGSRGCARRAAPCWSRPGRATSSASRPAGGSAACAPPRYTYLRFENDGLRRALRPRRATASSCATSPTTCATRRCAASSRSARSWLADCAGAGCRADEGPDPSPDPSAAPPGRSGAPGAPAVQGASVVTRSAVERGVPMHLPRRAGPPSPAGPVVMGVVNVTPDSFSDGGRYADTDAALAHGRAPAGRRRRRARHRRGVDPARGHPPAGRRGARPGGAGDRRRSPPTGAVVSVDTMRAEVAAAALAAGATIVNDVSGGLADPEILDGRRGRRGDVRRHALARARRPDGRAAPSTTARAGSWAACAASSAPGSRRCARPASPTTASCSTPGSGSPSDAEHNWELVAALGAGGALAALGCPLLVGASRKSFLGRPAGRRRRRRRARSASARSPGTPSRSCWRSAGSGGCGCTTCGAPVMCCGCGSRRSTTPPGARRDRRARGPRHRVLRPPRRLRVREARGPDLRGRPRRSASTPRRRRAATTCTTPSTTGASWPR